MQVLMIEGATYYIVISGFGSDSGAFQLDVTATDGNSVSSLPVKGSYAVAQGNIITPASVNGSSSGNCNSLILRRACPASAAASQLLCILTRPSTKCLFCSH